MTKKKKLKIWQKVLIGIVSSFAIILSVKAFYSSEVITFSGDQITYLEYGQDFNSNAIRMYINDKLSNKKPTIDLSGIDYDKLGEYQIVIQYINDKGNVIYEENRSVIIRDTKRPTIKLLGDWSMTITQSSTFEEPGYEVKDNYNSSGDITVEITGEVDTSTVGTYTITYKATDTSGNYTATKRVVEVEEKKAESITKIGMSRMGMGKPSGNINIPEFPSGPEAGITNLDIGEATISLKYGSAYEESGYTAIDTKDGDITQLVTVTGVDLLYEAEPGTYEIIYSVTNSDGIVTEIKRTVIVWVDPPTITLETDIVTYMQTDKSPDDFEEFIKSGVTAEDALGRDLTNYIKYSCYKEAGEEILYDDLIALLVTADYELAETFIIKYTVTDQWGNKSTIVERELTFVANPATEEPVDE